MCFVLQAVVVSIRYLPTYRHRPRRWPARLQGDRNRRNADNLAHADVRVRRAVRHRRHGELRLLPEVAGVLHERAHRRPRWRRPGEAPARRPRPAAVAEDLRRLARHLRVGLFVVCGSIRADISSEIAPEVNLPTSGS